MAILTVNDDVTIPGVVVCLHVETELVPNKCNPDKFTHKLRCWGAVAGRIEGGKWTREKSTASGSNHSFWQWLNFVRLIHRPVWLFTQNLPTCSTVLGLWTLLESGEFSLHRRATPQTEAYRRKRGDKEPDKALPGLLIANGPPDAVVCYHQTGWKLIILDCRNFWETTNASPAEIAPGDSLGVPSMNAPVANWLEYSVNTARSISKRVTDLLVWHRQQELGRFGFSIAGCALAAFRHRFMCHSIDLPDDQDDRDREREAYYPGRVEAFWVGTHDKGTYIAVGEARARGLFDDAAPEPPFYHLDARSFYGAVGAFCDLPCACVESCENPPDGRSPSSGRIVEYLARVDIASQDDVYPVRHSGRVIYARGHFGTVLAGPELARAAKRCHIVRWYWWRRYRLEPIFQKYSLALWEEREKAKDTSPAVYAACKSMLARLHGKFLQRRNRWEARPKMIAPAAWEPTWTEGSATTGRFRKFRAIAWDVEEEVDAGDSPHCFPAIAAWVASWGREWLQTWINYAGKENVLYVATDSLVVTENGKSRLEDRGIIYPGGIGSVRIVARVESLSIRAANNLKIGPRRILSGRNAPVGPDASGNGESMSTDSLRSILFVRNGRTVESCPQQWTDPRPVYQQRIGPGGWLEPPQVNTCRENSTFTELVSASSS